MARTIRIEIVPSPFFRGGTPQWHWRQRAKNGEIVCHAEKLYNLSGAHRAVVAFLGSHGHAVQPGRAGRPMPPARPGTFIWTPPDLDNKLTHKRHHGYYAPKV